MRTSTSHSNRGQSELAERQMRNWVLELQTQKRLSEERQLTQVHQLIHPYVVISREAGVNGGEIAQAIAAKCAWRALDDELLDYMAEHDHLSRLALDFVDERAVSWFYEMFGTWLEKQLVSQAEYVSRLGKLVLLAAQHESTVFVGRGVQFMLPRGRGLAVRIIAPTKVRMKSIMERRQCNERQAKEFIETTDNGREQFVRRYFHHDISDPQLFDFVINLAHIPREEAIDVIASAAKRHEQRTLAEAAKHTAAQR